MQNYNLYKKAKILLVFALFIEAKPFIERFQLWVKEKYLNFQIFYDESVIILITWTWKISMSSWVTYAFIKFPEIFYILNIWIAWHWDSKIWDIFLIDKIIDNDTGNAFYPDFLFENYLNRGNLRTISKIWDWSWELELIDMEWSTFFEIASRFLKVSSIALIKIVSDNANIAKLEKFLIVDILKKSVLDIVKFIEKIPLEKVDKSIEEKEEIYNFAKDNFFSVTQSRMLTNLVWSLHVQKDESVSSLLKWINIKNKAEVSGVLARLEVELNLT